MKKKMLKLLHLNIKFLSSPWTLHWKFFIKNGKMERLLSQNFKEKSHVPFLYFDFIVFTILLNLSYLPTRCLSMATSTGVLNMPCRLIRRTVRSTTFWHRFSMWSYRMSRILSRTHLPVGTPAPPSGSLERAVSAYSACLHMLNRRPKKSADPYRELCLSENLICNRETSIGPISLNPDSADCIWSDCLFGI